MSIRNLIGRIRDQRQTSRIQTQGLVAYYWTGGIPKPRHVRDIGLNGAYIVAPDIFYPGTLVQIVLENTAAGQGDGKGISNIAVRARVCRQTPEGFDVAFLFSDASERRQLRRFLGGLTGRGQVEAAPAGSNEPNAADQSADTAAAEDGPGTPDQNEVAPGQDQPMISDVPAIKPGEQNERRPEEGHMANRRRLSSGQALIEFALILPLLFLLIVNVIHFGGFLYDWSAVSNAARTGAQYMIMGGGTVTAPKVPTATQVTRREHRSFKKFLAAAQARGNSGAWFFGRDSQELSIIRCIYSKNRAVSIMSTGDGRTLGTPRSKILKKCLIYAAIFHNNDNGTAGWPYGC